MTYFLDTNVLIDLLNGNSKVLAAFKHAYLFDDDILIGSLAVIRDAVLVTNNTRHFSRLIGIKLQNWIE